MNFQKMLTFVQDFTRQFDIGPNNAQIGVATFSSDVHERIKLNQYRQVVKKNIELSYIHIYCINLKLHTLYCCYKLLYYPLFSSSVQWQDRPVGSHFWHPLRRGSDLYGRGPAVRPHVRLPALARWTSKRQPDRNSDDGRAVHEVLLLYWLSKLTYMVFIIKKSFTLIRTQIFVHTKSSFSEKTKSSRLLGEFKHRTENLLKGERNGVLLFCYWKSMFDSLQSCQHTTGSHRLKITTEHEGDSHRDRVRGEHSGVEQHRQWFPARVHRGQFWRPEQAQLGTDLHLLSK